ncbi:MAG: methylenetetrahydrofolate reductase C-terminal domain-containing protein [Betaproteobacteria bacterium]|nr:methylenetetrahydrofolate reductase C-terminal domain-containing protein [Betaproteobacteria bacterium]
MLSVRRWSVRHSRLLENTYRAFERVLFACRPLIMALGPKRVERPVAAAERVIKSLLFDCRMCGRCVLTATGMSCPMNCPKLMRNGPCGGVRQDGGCEVKPEMQCVWVEGWRGGLDMRAGGLSSALNPPVDSSLSGSSAWLRVVLEPPKAASAPSPALVPPSGGQLEQLLRDGIFAVTAEFSPPDSANPDDVYRNLGLYESCVDAINVTDGSGANCHMSSLGVAALLLRAGCEPVMQVSCRDRNRIAIQGDLLGAAALGVRNVLCLSGDAVAIGDHPGARQVGDLDSATLLDTARIMRDESRFLSGRKLTSPPRLFLGAADNPFAPPFDMRPIRLAKKIAAGAQFIQTQYCFDLEMLERYMERVREEGLQDKCFILAGVGPVASAKTARWLRTRVPGVHIPDEMVRRLEQADNPREEGIRICIEMIQAIRRIPGIAGVHIMAAKQEAAIARIVQESGVLAGRAPLFLGSVESRERRTANAVPV